MRPRAHRRAASPSRYPGPVFETTLPVGTTRSPGPDSERWVGPGGGEGSCWRSARSGSRRAVPSPPPRAIPRWWAPMTNAARRRRHGSTRRPAVISRPAGGAPTAELVKLMELTYRDVASPWPTNSRSAPSARESTLPMRSPRRTRSRSPRARPRHRRRRPLRTVNPWFLQRTGPRTARGARAPHQRRHAEPGRAPPGAVARPRGRQDDSHSGTAYRANVSELPLAAILLAEAGVGCRRACWSTIRSSRTVRSATTA